MIFKDYYKILGLENTRVTIAQIKVSYREQAKKYHPDLNVGKKDSEEIFKDINEAYKVLSNVGGKRKYDKMWNTHIGSKKKGKNKEEQVGEKGTVKDEFFNMFFGNVKKVVETNPVKEKANVKNPVKGESVETEIAVSIADAFFGVDKRISLRTVEGNMKSFTIKIPAGIRNNDKVRLMGQGKTGKNGGKNGDMFIKIKIEDNQKYKLDGYNIITDLLLTPWEAALGTRATINSIEDSVTVYIPPGIQSGEIIKIPAKGYKDGKGGRGDFVLSIKIMVQKELSIEEEDLYNKLKETSNFNPRTIKKN